ncbi:RNA polymerase-associated protein Ctr9 homolog [Strongyloides ratti]|uniref:RNA polymerase-associated protein Ctr9 homolog n=1 Tax=Strongyloides ratti TaxID=34506 RepID=A0A090KXD4_STRRB|nr:RNA polymerase-associated protein Ctr9 homolog [Strongyloides ratti]CEF62160.1 RNA polymerase-associated protein Ctr9 homolog [Strongyloides ratti]
MKFPVDNEDNLAIPKRFGGEAIMYSNSKLPEVDTVISELSGECCKSDVWRTFALAYYRQNKISDFYKIILKAIEIRQSHIDENYHILKLYDALVSYEIMCCWKETDKLGDKIFRYHESHILQRAFYLLYEGQKLEHAEAQFKFITNTNERNIPALIGYACILYNKKEYFKSLKYFKKALKIYPKSPPYVRLGIGYCLLKLGYIEKAKVAFERVLELEKDNSYALTALAILDFANNTLKSTTAGATKLIKSWKLDTNNISTALELSDFLFLKGEYEKSEKYSKIALQLSESKLMKGRSHYFFGRNLHQKGEIDLAIYHYAIAIDLCGSNFLNPLFGLGQLYAKKRKFEKAIEYFEMFLALSPNNIEVKKALIMMYMRSSNVDTEKNYTRMCSIKKYFSELLVGENQDDPLLINEYSRFMEKTNISISLKETSRLINIYKDLKNDLCPIELVNNYGVYLYMNGMYLQASTAFSECFARIEKIRSKNQFYAESLELTLTFNLARAKEELGFMDDAIELYEILLKWKPNYKEAILRLGKIAEKRTNYNEAISYYQNILSDDPNNVLALSALGYFYLNRKNYLEAQKSFETIIKLPNQRTNAYAYLGLGTIWLDQLYKPNRNKNKDDDHISRAFEMFSKVLRYHPMNIYAGNGIGVLLTFIGDYEKARECFAIVRENLLNNKGPWLNLAYVYGMLKNYLNSIQLYKAAIDKFGLDEDTETLIALGYNYWKKKEYINAMNYVNKAVNIDPFNLYAIYNLAKICTKVGLNILESSNNSLTEIDNAIAYFNKAKNYFININKSLNSDNGIKIKWKYLNIEQITEEILICDNFLKKANLLRPKILEAEKNKEESKNKQKEVILKLEEEKLVQLKVLEEQNIEKQSRLKILRNEFLNMNKDALKILTNDDKKKNINKNENGKKKKKNDLEDFISDDEVVENSDKKKRNKQGKSERKKKHNDINKNLK